MTSAPRERRRSRARLTAAGGALLCLLLFLSWLTHRPGHKPESAKNIGDTVAPVSPPVAAGPGNAAKPPSVGKPAAQMVLKYGHSPGEIGFMRGQEHEPIGPESFAVTRDGGVLIADVANHRIVLYSSTGQYMRSLELPGVSLGDVATDRQGRLYVYDQLRRTLQQFAPDGTAGNTLMLNSADIDTRGYFHVSGNSVYFADAAARDVLIGILKEGALVAPETSSQRTAEGIHGESGRVFALGLNRGESLQMQIRDAAADSPTHSLSVALPGIVSARFVGEDQSQRIYIQTERALDEKQIALEVLAFSPAGELLSTTRMPENDYAIWTARLVDVQSDGTIVQFLPQRDQAKLNLFTN